MQPIMPLTRFFTVTSRYWRLHGLKAVRTTLNLLVSCQIFRNWPWMKSSWKLQRMHARRTIKCTCDVNGIKRRNFPHFCYITTRSRSRRPTSNTALKFLIGFFKSLANIADVQYKVDEGTCRFILDVNQSDCLSLDFLKSIYDKFEVERPSAAFFRLAFVNKTWFSLFQQWVVVKEGVREFSAYCVCIQ